MWVERSICAHGFRLFFRRRRRMPHVCTSNDAGDYDHQKVRLFVVITPNVIIYYLKGNYEILVSISFYNLSLTLISNAEFYEKCSLTCEKTIIYKK